MGFHVELTCTQAADLHGEKPKMPLMKYFGFVSALFLFSCVTHKNVALDGLISGEQTEQSVEVEGIIYSIGTNLISLHGSGSSLRGDYSCVALVVSEGDRTRAVQARGKAVRVRGTAIPLAHMRAMFPNHSGLINGRLWRGTQCEGAFVVLVDEFRVLG